jgi:UDP:flavonoid glycosyltransferase YjiC (YdhE family)
MRFLLTTWEGGGTVTPMAELARKLIARGHRVRMISDDCSRAEAEAAGAEFAGWRRAPNRPDRSRTTQRFRDWAEATPSRLTWLSPTKRCSA